jgi:6-phosphofructokinase
MDSRISNCFLELQISFLNSLIRWYNFINCRLITWSSTSIRIEAIKNVYNKIEGLAVYDLISSFTNIHQPFLDEFPIIGVPLSIDNDINGTEMGVGVDTSLHVINEAIEKILNS